MRRVGTALILLSVLVAAAGRPATPVARADDPTPRFIVTPERALHDREVSIQLLGLKPNQRVTVRATRGPFKSETEFVADAEGNVDVAKSTAKPDQKVAPLRILWSMKRDPDAKAGKSYVPGSIDPVKVSLSALADGKEVAAGGFEQIFVAPDVERIPVKAGKLRGAFFRPKAKGKYPGVMTLGGSEGGNMLEPVAALLAAHGYAVLNLPYFDYEDLPAGLLNIPLEYFEDGLKWLEDQDCVAAGQLGVIGTSRGGELALLLGSRLPKVKAVVASVTAHVVLGSWSWSDPKKRGQAAWTYEGKPIPRWQPKVDQEELRKIREANPEDDSPAWRFMLKDADAAKRAAIAVEKINGPVLLISAKDDRLCPSAEMVGEVEKRLREHKHPHAFPHLSYDDAGHYIGIPYRPMGASRFQSPQTKQWFYFGGTPQGNAFASWDSWNKMLKFLDEAFKKK